MLDIVQAEERLADSILNNPAPATARTSDPASSHEAANSIKQDHMRLIYREIIRIIGTQGGSTDAEIAEKIECGIQSDSGIRTRRKELERAGYVQFAQYRRRNVRHLYVQVWELTPKGEYVFTQLTGLYPLKGRFNAIQSPESL